MAKIYNIPSIYEPTYRKYAIRLSMISYHIWHYFDSKKEFLEDLDGYKKSKAKGFEFKNNKYIPFIKK